jgi:integrase
LPLTEVAIKALKPKPVRYLVSDGKGLNIEMLPSGKLSWIFRYRFRGRPEKVMLGRYPEMSLRRAREERDKRATLAAAGQSPAEIKKLERQQITTDGTLKSFGERYLTEVIEKRWKNPHQIKRWLTKDIYPLLGNRPLKEISPAEIQRLVFQKRDTGHPTAAARIRSILFGLFDYAVVCEAVVLNPVTSLPARFVTVATERTRALSPAEIRIFLRTLYTSEMRLQFKLALHLILLTLVRKSELMLARWEEFNLQDNEWEIPAERAKNGKPHVVYLSTQAIELLDKLKALSAGSALVLPGRLSLTKPYAGTALNKAMESPPFGIPQFTIHDLRRTASTLLHEKGYPSDVIEKALNHTIGGVRGVYNKAEYAEQRRKMLQFWGDFVEGLAGEKKVLVGNFLRAAN